MSSLINNAMSGLNAAQAALNTASNNISSDPPDLSYSADEIDKRQGEQNLQYEH